VERTFQGAKTGHVLLWTTPLARDPSQEESDAWNEFPQFWSFAYLVNQAVPYLAGLAGEKLNYEAGDDVVLPIDPAHRVPSYLVQGPDPKTPADRHSPLASNPALLIPSPQALGHWTVTPSAPGTNQPTIGFSMNPPEAETHVAPLESRDLDSLFGKKNYALADNPESLKHAVDVGRVGHELFPWLMAIILALVTAENFLANKFYRERPAT
jgi:hypothetical protein